MSEHYLYLRCTQPEKGCVGIELMRDISVVIPTLNEEKFIGTLLAQLQKCSDVIEIVVCDGGSQDGTYDQVSKHDNVVWVNAPKGRASQMNVGSRAACGDILLFLHADSICDLKGIQHIKSTLTGGVSAGSFYLDFDVQGFWYKVYSFVSKCDWTVFTYGDQGLFIKKSFFELIGGFREIPIMEDLDIVRRIKRQGIFKKIDFPITTRARRFKKHGVIFQQLRNTALVLLYYLGASPQWLCKFYKY